MTRWLFLLGFVLLLTLLTWLVARGLFWLIKPYLPNSHVLIMISVFVISGVMVAMLFVGQFRWSVGYLATLWLAILTIIITAGTGYLLRALGYDVMHGVLIRLFGVASFVGLVGMALYNAYTPVVRHLSIELDKPIKHPITLALASDLHLGSLFGSKQLYTLATILKQERVELLLMPGDIMDDDTHIYDGQNMKTAFETVVRAAKGNVVASLGNHDLYNNAERLAIANAIKATGAVLLDDKVATITLNGTELTVIGRFDDHAKNRLSTAELISTANTNNPVILLDHRPSQIDDNVKHPIDLQVSGHTHNGQIFPANFIVKAINRVGYGHEKINNTHVVVSSGCGFWGVPFRLASQSEIWVIKLVGKSLSNQTSQKPA